MSPHSIQFCQEIRSNKLSGHRDSSNEFLNEIDGDLTLKGAGLGGSVGCAVRLETRRSRVQPSPRAATFFRGD